MIMSYLLTAAIMRPKCMLLDFVTIWQNMRIRHNFCYNIIVRVYYTLCLRACTFCSAEQHRELNKIKQNRINYIETIINDERRF